MIISKLIGQKSKDGWSHMVADEDLSVVVDCGQRARYKTLKQIKKAECIVLTHSHADHVKNIGKILEMEYKGEVICTKETYNNMVKVYGDIIVKNKDIFKLLDYGEEYTVKGNKTVKLRDAGHCLGSAIVELNMGKDKKVVITGDVEANVDDEVCRLNDIKDANYVIFDSSSFNKRLANKESIKARIKTSLIRMEENSNTIIIPDVSNKTYENILLIQELLKENPEMYKKGVKICIEGVKNQKALKKAFKETQKGHIAINDRVKNLIKYMDKDEIEEVQNKIVLTQYGKRLDGNINKYANDTNATFLVDTKKSREHGVKNKINGLAKKKKVKYQGRNKLRGKLKKAGVLNPKATYLEYTNTNNHIASEDMIKWLKSQENLIEAMPGHSSEVKTIEIAQRLRDIGINAHEIMMETSMVTECFEDANIESFVEKTEEEIIPIEEQPIEQIMEDVGREVTYA